jgi:hypothetical protein
VGVEEKQQQKQRRVCLEGKDVITGTLLSGARDVVAEEGVVDEDDV